jgi:hypothetical protein
MRTVVALLFALSTALPTEVTAHDGTHGSAAAAARMRASAERLLAALPPATRDKVMRPFDDPDRLDWHYTPRSRNGVALKELDAAGRDAVHALLREGLSAAGYRKVVNIIELELVLREIETFGLMRDPERYHLTIMADRNRRKRGVGARGPSPVAQLHAGWERLAVDTPSFFGANPAQVAKGTRAGCACSRPRRTKRARCWAC